MGKEANRYLVAIDPVPDLDDALLQHLSAATRKAAADWKRLLVAPGLHRILYGASSEKEANDLAARIASTGLVPHVIERDDVDQAIEDCFEATFAERAGDGILFIGPTGTDLKVGSTSIRLVVSGRETIAGVRGYFVVIGLRDGAVPAVIMHIPHAELSKLAPNAEAPDDILSGVYAFMGRAAPYAVLERGLEAHVGKMTTLEELGATDLSHAAICAALLRRRFPPAPKPEAPPAPRGGPPPRVPMASLELEGRPNAGDGSSDGAVVTPAPPARRPGAPELKKGWSQRAVLTPEAAARRTKVLKIAAGVGAVLTIAVAWSLLRTPPQTEHLVHLKESWKSPYGPTFTFVSSTSPSDAMPDTVFEIALEKGGDRRVVRVPLHDEKTLRDAFGTPWRITAGDDAELHPPTWITIEARK